MKLENEIVLESWKIELGEASGSLPAALSEKLPSIYKKCILVFRSLFTYSGFLPAWMLTQRLSKTKSNNGLKVNYRVFDGNEAGHLLGVDNLAVPLYEGNERVIDSFPFGTTDSLARDLSVEVSYRINCDFRVDGLEPECRGKESSGSIEQDENNISAFLEMLKPLRTFRALSDPSADDPRNRRTSALLTWRQQAKDSDATSDKNTSAISKALDLASGRLFGSSLGAVRDGHSEDMPTRTASAAVDAPNRIPDTLKAAEDPSSRKHAHIPSRQRRGTASSQVDFWSGSSRGSRAGSVNSCSSSMNSSLHGKPIYDAQEQNLKSPVSAIPLEKYGDPPRLALPHPPVKLGSRSSFLCDICGESVNVTRRRDWK